MMMRTTLIALLGLWGLQGAAIAAEPTGRYTVSSPNNVLTVEFNDPGGWPTYQVLRFGKPVIAPSHIGFILKDAGKLTYDLHTDTSPEPLRSVDETWEQPWGERRFVRNHYNELTLHLNERTAPKRRLDLIVRVFDDGVGLRYSFPDQIGRAHV